VEDEEGSDVVEELETETEADAVVEVAEVEVKADPEVEVNAGVGADLDVEKEEVDVEKEEVNLDKEQADVGAEVDKKPVLLDEDALRDAIDGCEDLDQVKALGRDIFGEKEEQQGQSSSSPSSSSTSFQQQKKAKYEPRRGWVIWIIARLYLNDPELVEVDFSHQRLPVDDPLAFPRLIDALVDGRNTHLEVLKLNNCGLRASSVGFGFKRVLSKNTTLRHLELDTNPLDADCVQSLFEGLSIATKPTLRTLKISNLGKVLAESGHLQMRIVGLLEHISSLTVLGFELTNPHARDCINRKLMKNRDTQRQERQKEKVEKNNN